MKGVKWVMLLSRAGACTSEMRDKGNANVVGVVRRAGPDETGHGRAESLLRLYCNYKVMDVTGMRRL